MSWEGSVWAGGCMGAASEWGSPPCTVVTGSAPLWRLGLVGDGRVQGRAGDAALPMSRGSQNGGGGGGAWTPRGAA